MPKQPFYKIGSVFNQIGDPNSGYTYDRPKLNYIDTKTLGNTLIMLGGGRNRVEDKIDHSVGMKFEIELGGAVEKGQPIATLYAPSEDLFDLAHQKIIEAVVIKHTNKVGKLKPVIEHVE